MIINRTKTEIFIRFSRDLTIYLDDKGHFDGADYIVCGEWITYTREELEEVKYILHKYNIDIALS